MANSRPQDWSTYWRRQRITSFGNIFPNNYDGSIREFWQKQLVGDLHEVVDIACGNGALTWLADDILNGPSRKARITGVDFADIDPFKTLRRSAYDFPGVRFIGSTPAEALPFASKSVDLAISQYGLEYTDIAKCVPEIARVLKPSGRIALVLHDANSTVVKVATLHLEDCKAVLNLSIHDYALELNTLRTRLGTPEDRQNSDEFRVILMKLNTLTDQVRAIVQDYTEQSPIHRYMNEMTRAFADTPNESSTDREAEIIAARDRFSSLIKRNEHLAAAALSNGKRRHLVALLEQAGFSITESGVLAYRHETNIGATLVARRERT